jgi:hypothetical protein
VNPAEVGLLVLGLVGAIAGRRWSAARWGSLAAIAVWGGLTLAFRDDKARWGALDYPPTEWAGFVATYLAAGSTAGLATSLAAAAALAPRREAVAALGAAAWFAGAAVLWRVAVLASPGDAAWLDPALALRIGLGLVAVALLARARAAALVAVALIGLHEGLTARARVRGPAPELADLTLPTWVPEVAARVPAGCLVAPDGPRTVGAPPPYGPVKGCPSGAMPLDQAPLVGLPADAPVTALAGRHTPEEGAVRVLFRIADGWGMRAWRVSSLEVPVWSADRPVTPLPGARLVWVEGGRTRVAAAGVDEEVDPVEAIGRVPASVARLDVLIHPSAAPTVGALIERCGAIERARPVGTRCVVALGDPAAWKARLGGPVLAAPIEDDFEVIEAPELEEFR